jgi:hypothetical protein
MVRWLEDKFGHGAVPWVFFCATAMMCLAGIAGTIAFGVSGFEAGLAVSIPMILVGGLGTIPTGIILEDGGYI